jgi:hypothetical protein
MCPILRALCEGWALTIQRHALLLFAFLFLVTITELVVVPRYFSCFNPVMNEVKKWLWPDVSSRRQIEFAILEGYWACFLVAAITFLFNLIGLFRSFEPQTLILFGLAAVFGGLAYGIEHHSRAAAVTAFVLFILYRLAMILFYGFQGWLFSILVAVALLNAMRGAFAYRNLPAPPPGTPTLEQSFNAFRKIPTPPSD